MSLYIDDEFDATTLAELEQQVLERAREAWKWHVADEALYIYRQLAVLEGLIEEPKPGLFDLTSPAVQDLWEKVVVRQVTERYAGFKYMDHAVSLAPKKETQE